MIQYFLHKSKWFFVVLLTFCLSLGSNNSAFAQSDETSSNPPRHNFFIEGGGNAMAFSVNYDSRFGKKNSGLGYLVGLGGFTSFDSNSGTSLLAVPIQLNYLAGRGAHFFEAGIGATYTTNGFWENQQIEDKTPVLGTVTFGYRFQPLKSGFMLRTGITPFFGTTKKLDYTYDPVTGISYTTIVREPLFWPLYGGISVGYAF